MKISSSNVVSWAGMSLALNIVFWHITETQAGMGLCTRGRLASEECGGASGGISGEQTSSQVLQLLGLKSLWTTE